MFMQENSGAQVAQDDQQNQESMRPPGTEDASPEDEAELSRAMSALAEVLYKNEASFASIVKKLSNQNVPAGDRLADATVMLVSDIDSKLNLDEGVILEFAASVYDELYGMAQEAEAMELPDRELKQGLMVVLQLIMESYGVDEAEYSEFVDSIGEQGANDLINFYKGEQSNG